MTANLTDRAALFLRRAGLLAGLLAIIAGILGMHVLPGSHDASMAGMAHATQTPGQAADVAGPAISGHTGHGGAMTAPVVTAGDPDPAPGGSGCTGADPCAGMSMTGASCIPLGGTGSLAAPPPATVSFAAETQAPPAAATAYGYLPGSPSPGDLCISRT